MTTKMNWVKITKPKLEMIINHKNDPFHIAKTSVFMLQKEHTNVVKMNWKTTNGLTGRAACFTHNPIR